MAPRKAGQHRFLTEHLSAYYPLLPCVLGGLVWVRVFYASGMWQKPTVLSSVTHVQCPLVQGSRWGTGVSFYSVHPSTLTSCCPAGLSTALPPARGIAETLVTGGCKA